MGESLEPRASQRPADLTPTATPRERAEVHAASTRVTIAWPFSQIKLQEATAELSELTTLVGELVDALSGVVAEDRLAPLRQRVEALQERLR